MYSMPVTLVLVVGGRNQNGFTITTRIIKLRLPDTAEMVGRRLI
jgi:hypothetical protein